MTSNQIKRSEVEEKIRSDKEGEKLTKRGQDLKFWGDTMKGLGSVFKSAKANDPSWYNLDPQMVKDAANLPFHAPLGKPSQTGSVVGFGSTGGILVQYTQRDVENVPSFMSIGFVPTMGGADQNESNAANIAARNIYSYVRHANSGHANYESNDLFFYMMSMDSIVVMLSLGMHLYSAIKDGKSQNWSYPKGLIAALGFDPTEYFDGTVTANDVRAYLNQVITRIRPFAIPSTFPLFTRHAWLLTGQFKDADVTKSQEYIFKPDGCWLYDESVTPGRLWLQAFNYGEKWSTYVYIMEDMITRLVQSEDIGIMSGDILKAYGEGALFSWPTVLEDYHIESVFNPEILNQITNASVLGIEITQYGPGHTYALGECEQFIVQDPVTGIIHYETDEYITVQGTLVANPVPYLEFRPIASIESALKSEFANILNNPGNIGYFYPNQEVHLMSMYKDSPTPDDVMVSTRLIADAQLQPNFNTDTPATNPYVASDTMPMIRALGHGTELVTKVRIFSGTEGLDAFTPSLNQPEYCDGYEITLPSGGGNAGAAQFAEDSRGIIRMLSKFDWCPRIRMLVRVAGGRSFFYYDNFEIKNYLTLTPDETDSIHRTAVYSEFGIPLLGTKRR